VHQEVVLSTRNYIDNSVADSKDVDAGIGHELLAAGAAQSMHYIGRQ
jgi:hypothetical protein